MKHIFILFVIFFLSALQIPSVNENISHAKGSLNILIWTEYMDPDIIKNFEKKYNIDVKIDYYESNNEMLARLQKEGLGHYDIIVPSTYFIPILKSLNLIQPLDHKKIPNISNLDSIFTRVPVDPFNKFAIPYLWGTSGLAINTDNINNIEPSLALLFDPKSQIGNFVLFNDARETIGFALIYLGYSINTIKPERIQEATNLLLATTKRAGFLGFYSGITGLNKLLNNTSSVSLAHMGDALSIQEKDKNIHYIIPKEGGEIWTDLLAIPNKAPNLEYAYLFINHILKPEIAAQLSINTKYPTPNAAAKAFLLVDNINHPQLYPSRKIFNNLEYMEDLGKHTKLYEDAWAIIKAQ